MAESWPLTSSEGVLDFLREIGHEQGKIEKAFNWLHLPFVDLNGVTDWLKSVERDTHRQNNIQPEKLCIKSKRAQPLLQACWEKVEAASSSNSFFY